jgi:hypothetical protein
MALATVGAPSKGSALGHVAVLAGVTLGFFLLAVRRMHGGGFRLLGAHPRRTLAIVAGLGAVLLVLSVSGVFGGKPARLEDADAATDAASAATGTPASPVGVPAPADARIADFDAGAATASFGVGFSAAGDDMRGGNSTASQRVVEGGAEGSAGALEVTGEIGSAIQYPFAGAMFFPEGPPMQGLMDFSRKKSLSFMARGDGRRYTLMIMSGVGTGGIPLMQDFVAGPEWQRVTLNLAEYSNADWQRVRLLGFGSMGPVGVFRFQIDDVRLD